MTARSISAASRARSVSMRCGPNLTADDRDWLARKLKIYDMVPARGLDHFRKIVAGKQLWNYDNLEPSEKKLVL